MITTVLVDHPWLATLLLGVAVVVSPVLGRLVVPRPRVAWSLALLSLVPVAVLTLSPSGVVPYPGCEVDWPLPTPGRVELVANVALFVVPTTLVAVATGRALLALVGLSVLSALVELVQLVLPVVGRSCDTSDWLSNTIGAAVGAVLGALVLVLVRQRSPRLHAGVG